MVGCVPKSCRGLLHAHQYGTSGKTGDDCRQAVGRGVDRDGSLDGMKSRAASGRAVVAPILAFVAVALVALAAGALVEAFRPAPAHRAIVISPPASATVTAAQVTRWFDAGLPALADRRRAAWLAALSAQGAAPRSALDDLYRHLAPIPWTHLHALVVARRGVPDVFDVRIEGRPAGAGPSTRIVAERLLAVSRVQGRLVVTGDRSPARMRHMYLMALRRPRAVVRDGAVVIADASWRPLAEELAGDMPYARAAVAAELGVSGGRPIVIVLYSSAAEVSEYLGQARTLEREHFFARLPTTAPETLWWPTDVGVLAPALAPADPWTRHMLAHEVTHTLTWRWFYHTAHAPPLLLEGLATAVEADRSFAPLRAEVARGNRGMPLISALAKRDLWNGVDMTRVTLAYLEGAALVKYVLAGWGQAELKRFCVDIAQTSLKPAAIKLVVSRDLRVPWARFYTGWKAYVMTLP